MVRLMLKLLVMFCMSCGIAWTNISPANGFAGIGITSPALEVIIK